MSSTSPTKITKLQSKEIFDLANSDNPMTYTAIGERYGVSLPTVKWHIEKWQKKQNLIIKNSDPVQDLIIKQAIDVLTESYNHVMQIEDSIKHAEEIGVSPDRLSGLYNCRSRAFEFYCELKGDITRDTNVNVLNAVQVNQQESEKKFDQFIQHIMSKNDPELKEKITEILKEMV